MSRQSWPIPGQCCLNPSALLPMPLRVFNRFRPQLGRLRADADRCRCNASPNISGQPPDPESNDVGNLSARCRPGFDPTLDPFDRCWPDSGQKSGRLHPEASQGQRQLHPPPPSGTLGLVQVWPISGRIWLSLDQSWPNALSIKP